jgi:hypothetical protein
MSDASRDPEIAPTVSFRHIGIGVEDKVIGDQKAGFSDERAARERGEAPALLPPYPDKAAPRESLAERLGKRRESGSA